MTVENDLLRRSIPKWEFEILAQFRYELRKFYRFSEDTARSFGITPQQHQLLLAIKGFPQRDWATISELAERLQLRHHSVVGIVDRSEIAGMVMRTPSLSDRRVIEIHLTEKGEALLTALTRAHRQEIARMRVTWDTLDQLFPIEPNGSPFGINENQ